MYRRTYAIGLGSALAAGIGGCSRLNGDGPDEETDPDETTAPENETDDPNNSPQQPAQATLRNPSFEEELSGWTIGKDLPATPGAEDEPVDHSASTTADDASDGDRSLELYIDGVADDGTIWVERSVDVTDVETVTIDVYSRTNSANRMSQVAFFAGEKPDDGLSEGDFDREKDIEDHSGWKPYSYSVGELEGDVTVAIGMNVVWETEITRRFDDVRLETA
ncbi:hypothetical protein [Haloterrigena gelatinilytica]|uniref:hypothetical protein n=1 Tax=Haloterrigena gelatinilytica TaxID=2741724 RepID=UPI0020C6B941|nr:hypothetical protein [Haloterrigena gelatinilytica]